MVGRSSLWSVITACDAVDAMLSDRPYRKALSVDTVREELARYSGIQFDPAIVKVLLGSNVLERHAGWVGNPSTGEPADSVPVDSPDRGLVRV